MLNVSTQWHQASMAQFRYQAYLHVTIETVPPGLREGATVTSPDTNVRSNIAQLTDGLREEAKKIVTLEPNRWVLNDGWTVPSATMQTDDWWSQSGLTATTITVVFDKVYSIPGLYAYWDLESNTVPKSVTMKGFDLNGAQTYNVTVTDISSSEGYIEDFMMDDVKSVQIIINSWRLPHWRTRAIELVFGVFAQFDNVNAGRLMSATVENAANPVSGNLPVYNMQVVVQNYDNYFDPLLKKGLSKYITQQQVATVYWSFMLDPDTIEDAPTQKLLVENFDIPTDSKVVNINLTNRLALMTLPYYYGTYTIGQSKTLYALATEILQNTNMVREVDGEIPWVLDQTALSAYSTSAPLPKLATNALLQLISMAGKCWLTTKTDSGYISMMQPSNTPSTQLSLGMEQDWGDPAVTVKDKLQVVSVGVYHYEKQPKEDTEETDIEQIAKLEQVFTKPGQVILEYNCECAVNVSLSSSNNSAITSYQIYASYAIININVSTETTITIVAEGVPIVSSVNYIEVYKDPTVSNGIEVIVDNPLITSATHAQAIGEMVRDYYLRRSNFQQQYMGYPQLEPGDCINYKNVYGSSVVHVVRNHLEFNGGWSGTTEVV